MKLVFGLEADSRVYPDFPGSGPGVLDEEVVGPRGLVGLLEIQLGLSGPTKSEAVRIAAYAAKLQVALAERKTAFFAASFSRDPWATAERLLHWRDNLVLAGWAGTAIGTPRADDLAAAEAIRCLRDLPTGWLQFNTHWPPSPHCGSPKSGLLNYLQACRRISTSFSKP